MDKQTLVLVLKFARELVNALSMVIVQCALLMHKSPTATDAMSMVVDVAKRSKAETDEILDTLLK